MKKKTKTVIIQSRMGSSRLPGKVLKKLNDKTVLGHMIDRLKKSTIIDDIIICTTSNSEDDLIVNFCEKNQVKFYRGSENNVLSRFII